MKKSRLLNHFYIAIFTINLLFYLAPLSIALFQLMENHSPNIPMWMVVAGSIIAICGRIFSIVGGAILSKRREKLVSISIFRWSRNPITLGMHLTFLGLIICTNHLFLLIGLAFSVWNMHLKINIEEKHLIKKFG